MAHPNNLLTETLYENSDVAKELDLTPFYIGLLADKGILPIFARTRRGVRLYRAEDVHRLKKDREAASKPRKDQK
jgi:DNA-binding transcriptional MerR regulator